MFAIALWDRGRGRLVLLRDRLGKKPLLYAHLPDGSLAFASETKALLQLDELPRELDLLQLDAFLALQYAPRSGFRAVQKVPPGSYVVAENGSLRTERYWSVRTRPVAATVKEVSRDWIESVHDEVSAAVGHSSPVVTKRFYDHFVRRSFSPRLRAGLGLVAKQEGGKVVPIRKSARKS